MAVCQGEKGRVWSGVLRDGNSLVVLIREHMRTNWMGRCGAGGEMVR